MATAGALKEGYPYAYGPRYNDTLFRGVVTVGTSGTATVTLPLPMRFAGFPQVSLGQGLGSAGDPIGVTAVVGSGTTANQITISVWKITSGVVALSTAGSHPVFWEAWGSVTDNFVDGAY